MVHYCVANMPGAVPRTSTFALNNATLPFVLALAGKGWREACRADAHLRKTSSLDARGNGASPHICAVNTHRCLCNRPLQSGRLTPPQWDERGGRVGRWVVPRRSPPPVAWVLQQGARRPRADSCRSWREAQTDSPEETLGMDVFVQQVINGLVLGSMYALVALGYTMVYGIINLINFAHGEVLMFGAMVAWTVATSVPEGAMPGWLLMVVAMLAAMVACAALNFAIEKVAYRPLRSAPRLAPLITAMGMSLLLQTLAMIIWKPNPKPFPQLLPPEIYFLQPRMGR
jgi:hypothetical protein